MDLRGREAVRVLSTMSPSKNENDAETWKSCAGMVKFSFKPVKPYTVDYGMHVKQCTNFVCLEPFGGHLVLAVVHRATADRHLPKYNAAVEQITNVP